MATQAATQSRPSSYFQAFETTANYLIEKGTDVIHYAQEPGVVQKTCQAGLRSMVGLYVLSQFPASAAVGIVFTVAKPEMAKTGVSLIEGAISGIWTRMTFNQKLAIAAAGVASVSCFDPTFFFTAAGTVFSFKLGAEIAQRNLTREDLHEAQRIATQNMEMVQQQ